MFQRLLTTALTLVVGALITLAILWRIPIADAAPLTRVTTTAAPVVVQESVAAASMISYQGRLLDPLSGQAKADGSYTMAFRLYPVDSGGSALWTESKSVLVNKGLFSTMLGDTTPLDTTMFDGQDLYLGITIGTDPETVPRQQLAHVAYAIYAGNADKVDGQEASAFAAVSHNHDGAAITSGVVADAHIDAALTRDNEVLPLVLSNDGAGSGLDADLLDGQSAAAFATAGHNHDAAYVNVAGDTMTGALTVPSVNYASPHTHYFVVGSEAFVPGSNVDYFNTYGNGGAYIATATSGALVAPVHLPQGATITTFQVFYYDNASSDLSVSLQRQFMTGGGYSSIANVTTSGASASYRNGTTSSISSPTVDNRTTSYHIYAFANPWDVSGNLRIKGALVTYTINAAP